MIPHNPPQIVNYMIDQPTPEDLALSDRICQDTKTFSDSSGMSNGDKWAFAMDVMECDDCNLFSALSFEDVYMIDDPLRCEAACYVADLRSQFLQRHLLRNPLDMESHLLYVKNKQWYARFKNRMALQMLEEHTRNLVLT